jgi:hypothetical protein
MENPSRRTLVPFDQLQIPSKNFFADFDVTPKNFPRQLLSNFKEGIEFFECPYPGCKYVATFWDLTKVSSGEYRRSQEERYAALRGSGSLLRNPVQFPETVRQFGIHYLLKHDFPYARSLHEIEPYYSFTKVVKGIESVYCPRCPFYVPMKKAKDDLTRSEELFNAGRKFCEHYVVQHLYKGGKPKEPNPLAIMPLPLVKRVAEEPAPAGTGISSDWCSKFHEGKDVFICSFKGCNFAETTGIPTTRDADGGYSKASVVALVRLAKHYMLTHDFPRCKDMTPEEILQARLCVVEQSVCGDIGAGKFSMMCPRCGFALPVLGAPTEQLYFQFWNHYRTHLYSEEGTRLKPKAEYEIEM